MGKGGVDFGEGIIQYIDSKITGMRSYKIGDRVRVIQVSPGSKDIKVGYEGVIMNFISAHFYRIKLDKGISVNLSARQLEKVL